jgi:membrane dipeptidase
MTQSAVPFVADSHSDFVNRIVEQRRAGVSGSFASEYLPALQLGGVRLVAMQVGGDSAGQSEHHSMATALEKISYLKSEVAACDGVRILRTKQEFDDWQASDEIGIVMAFEGGKAFVDNIAFVSIYHDLGIRMAALTWNDCNLIACGCGFNSSDQGLTDFGVNLVQELGRRGIILDVSHLSDAGVSHALQVATGQVVVTHSNARALCDHVRNMTDDHLRAIGERGGVVGVNFFPRMLTSDRRPGPAEIVEQVKYLVDLVGEDAVGFGPDFIDYSVEAVTAALRTSSVDYGTDYAFPTGLESTKDLWRLPDLLSEAGFTTSQSAKILGGNWARVFRSAMT